eukprot:6480980-Amphidinium_carterae.1
MRHRSSTKLGNAAGRSRDSSRTFLGAGGVGPCRAPPESLAPQGCGCQSSIPAPTSEPPAGAHTEDIPIYIVIVRAALRLSTRMGKPQR